ncbi:hypothetical protein [Streptomyces sp. NBC_00366]|uniref:hypothetical protein n=1 Tax=Streptomyces sp. NBC_00366 TaxID=2975727 RepID=UPI002E252CDA
MANPTVRSRAMNAAARAAAKRTQRVEPLTPEPSPRAPGSPQVPRARQAPETPQASRTSQASREEAPSPPPRRRLLTVVVGALLVVGLVAASVLGWQYAQERRTESARSGALTAARTAAPFVLSYDYRHLDRDFARARTHLTGHFRDEYGKTTTSVVGPTAKKYHGVVNATVAAASVASASPDRVTVLLFVNQVTRSTQVSGSRLDLNRVRMTMNHTSEGWQVSAVDAL